MRMTWVVCVLLGAVAWGQAARSAPSPQPAPAPATGQPTSPDTSASVPDDAAVLTITGVCASPAQPPAANASADCKTVITKAEFEKLVNALAPPTATVQQRKQLASALPQLMAWSKQAKERGIDQTEQYKQTLEFAKMQILRGLLQRKLQEEAADISDADIEKYYKDNPDAFEQYNVDRIFVPRSKQVEAEAAVGADKEQS